MTQFPEIPPVGIVYGAMQSAEIGQMPPFDSTSLLHMLELDGNIPDGKDLAGRLLGDSHEFSDVRAFVGVMRGADRLIEVTNSGRENPAELAVAQAVGSAVVIQISREDDICPGARSMALASTREDIIPQVIRTKLASSESWEEQLDLDEARMLQAAIQDLISLSFELMIIPPEELVAGSRAINFEDWNGLAFPLSGLPFSQQPPKKKFSLRNILRGKH